MGSQPTNDDDTPQAPEKAQMTPPPPMDAFPPSVEEDATTSSKEKDSSSEAETTTTIVPQEEDKDNQLALQPPEQDHDNKYECGDHVYQWCSVLGIPGVFQHHGIVIDVQEIAGGGEDEQLLTIADFSNLLLKQKEEDDDEDDEEEEEEGEGSSSRQDEEEEDTTTASLLQQDEKEESSTRQPTPSASFLPASGPSQKSKIGGLRVYRTASTTKGRGKWHKVQYADKSWFLSHLLKRSGTFTPVESDPPTLVLQRVSFLMAQANYNHTHDSITPNNDTVLPNYHSIFANCECVAVWCKTGHWSTLQAASMLSHAAVGQAKATATLAGAVAGPNRHGSRQWGVGMDGVYLQRAVDDGQSVGVAGVGGLWRRYGGRSHHLFDGGQETVEGNDRETQQSVGGGFGGAAGGSHVGDVKNQ